MISDWSEQNKLWKYIQVDDNIHVICATKQDDVWKILLTNLAEIWIETLTDDEILNRGRNLNPLLDIDEFDWQEIMAKLLNDIPRYVVEASTSELKLRIGIEGVMFKFTLNLLKGTPQQFLEHVTKPLCLSSMEILRQHEILLDLVKRKDEEIAEYKAEGAELIRKHIQTPIFNENLLKKQFSLPDMTDYTSAFQASIKFYNTMDLCALRAKKEKRALSIFQNSLSNAAESESSYRNISHNINDNENSNRHIDTESNLSKKETTPTKPKRESIMSSKLKSLPITIHKPSKKVKKSLNDFIM